MKSFILLLSLLCLAANIDVNAKEVILKKGTVLTCPSDNVPVLKLVSDIEKYQVVTDVNLYKSLIDNYQFIHHNQMPCSVFYSGCLHTSEGWRPDIEHCQGLKGVVSGNITEL